MDELRAVMIRQVRQMSRLVDDLLDVARIARGAIRLQKERVDIATLVGQAIESVQPIADERGHHLHVDLPADPLFVDADVVRLNEVFSNILDNAIKYTGRDGTIWVTARRQGNYALVRIRDNGPGICESMLVTIFEMFSQASSTLDHSVGGLGIGLFLVKQLVELHGGKVEALSAGPGTGTEFVVTLPCCPVERVAGLDALAGRLLRQSPAIRHHKIVVADDSQESASMLAEMLRTLGQDVSVATGGAAAVESVIARHPQIVFLDIAMPGMNGYEVAKRLRSEPETKSVVLVALTGYGQPEDRQRAFEAGFNHHLTKPANIEAIEELLVAI